MLWGRRAFGRGFRLGTGVASVAFPRRDRLTPRGKSAGPPPTGEQQEDQRKRRRNQPREAIGLRTRSRHRRRVGRRRGFRGVQFRGGLRRVPPPPPCTAPQHPAPNVPPLLPPAFFVGGPNPPPAPKRPPLP